MDTTSGLCDELAGIVGEEHVLTEPDVRAPYESDWTRRYRGRAGCVVRPGDVSQVADVLRACARYRVSVVAQGGNTGLVGGGIPRDGQVVLSAVRLCGLDPVEPAPGLVTAGAGTTIAELQRHARAAGFCYGVDLGARDSATVGGTLATNAGGVRTIRYGDTRAQVAGVEAVLADGTIISRLSGLAKDNSGYDLSQLLVGSEGTLGVITAATLRLHPDEPMVVTALVGVTGIAEAVAACRQLRAAVPALRAVEYIEAGGVELVCKVRGAPVPPCGEHPAYLLVEATGSTDPMEGLAAVPVLADAAVAGDPAGRERLWSYRERLTEAVAVLGVPHKLDVALPTDRLPEFRERLEAEVEDEWHVFPFGHLAIGNLHLNVVGPAPADHEVDDRVFRLVAACGGTFSAEHGVGRAKTRWLRRFRSAEEIATQRRIKDVLDPRNLLNPGVIYC